MIAVLSISVVIVAIVIILAVVTTSSAYAYKHTVDPIDRNLHLNHEENEHEKTS